MKFEINTHCWKYYRLLTYHLSGFVLHPPKDCEVDVSVCYTKEDKQTSEVLDFFEPLFESIPNVNLVLHNMEVPQLMRRGIGRQERSFLTQADWMWYADCDMVVHGTCLDTMASHLATTSRLLYHPAYIQISKDHAIGDELIRAVKDTSLIEVPRDVSLWTKHRYSRSIGGVQICDGKHLRNVGYLPAHSKYLRPCSRWRRTYEDRVFRSHYCNHRGHKIRHGDVCTNIFRIRHGQCGRDSEGIEN